MTVYQGLKLFVMTAAVAVLYHIAVVQQDIDYHIAGEKCYEQAN